MADRFDFTISGREEGVKPEKFHEYSSAIDKVTGSVKNLGAEVDHSTFLAWLEKQETRAQGSVRALREYTATVVAMGAGMAVATKEIAQHGVAVDKLTNLYRGLRLLASPTLGTAATLGTGFAIEAMIRNASAVAGSNRAIAFSAARSGLTFDQIASSDALSRIEGAETAGVVSGKTRQEIQDILDTLTKLPDPVEKAALLFERFGANAEKAMAVLRPGLVDSMKAADGFAASFTKADRESLERFKVTLGGINDKVHEIGSGIKSWWETGTFGKRDIAMLAAHVSDTIGRAPSSELVLGLDQPKGMPSFVDVLKQKADSERVLALINRIIPGSSDTITRSDAAMGRFDASKEGLEEKLSGVLARQRKAREQLGDARGTDLENTLRTTIIQTDQEAASIRKSIDAIKAKEQAERNLALSMERVLELEKRSREILLKSTLNDPDSPLAQFNFTRAKIGEELADELRKNPDAAGSKELETKIRTSFGRQLSAAEITLRKDLEKFYQEFDKTGIEAGRRFSEGLEKSGREIVSTGDEFIREHPEIFGQSRGIPVPAGYISPEQQLRNAQNNERRGMSQLGLRNALAGGSEGDLIGAAEKARLKYADDELKAALRIADAKNNLIARRDALDAREQRTFGVRMERENALLEIAVRQKEELRNLSGELFDSILRGSQGIKQFFANLVLSEARKIFQNILGDALGAAPHLGLPGKIFQGTMLGTDPLAGYATGGRGIYKGGGVGDSPAGSADMLAYMDNPEMADLFNNPIGPGAAKPGMSLRKGLGIGGAAAAGGFGIYSGIRGGGARGVLTAAGSAAGAVGLILQATKVLKSAGLIGEVAGLTLGLATMFLPDPKLSRDKEENERLAASRYQPPVSTNYTRDRYGRDYDSDVSGNLRPIVHVHVDTLDSKSFIDNADKVMDAVTVALEAKRSPRASMALRNTVMGR